MDCQAEMSRDPVKPGTPVFIPVRGDSGARKQPRRRAPSAEDQLKALRKQVRLLAALLAVAVLVIALLTVPAWKYLFEQRVLPGQNYSSFVTEQNADP